jgi:sensor histidine kinase regulating citrate/malate metabolism
MTDGTSVRDQIHLVGDRVLVVNRAEAAWRGRVVGSVVTLRDHTELQAVSGELDSVRGLAESLRSQTHEAANRLHTVVSLIELGRPDDAVEFATGELAAAQSLADRIQGTDAEPVVAALLLGKSAQAAERGIALVIDPASSARGLPLGHQDVVTVLGNLVDNAFDAVADSPTKTVEVRLRSDAATLELDVDDSGPGLAAADASRAFERGWTTKAGQPGIRRGIGLALVAQVVRRNGGAVTTGRSALGGASFRVRIGSR